MIFENNRSGRFKIPQNAQNILKKQRKIRFKPNGNKKCVNRIGKRGVERSYEQKFKKFFINFTKRAPKKSLVKIMKTKRKRGREFFRSHAFNRFIF